jgi:hypothetical protein
MEKSVIEWKGNFGFSSDLQKDMETKIWLKLSYVINVLRNSIVRILSNLFI